MCRRFSLSSSSSSTSTRFVITKFSTRHLVVVHTFSSVSILAPLTFHHHRYVSASANEQFIGSAQVETPQPKSSASSSNSSSNPRPPTADFTTTCPFTCLGLTRSASKEQVRENFLQLAKVHHPDVGGEAVKFKRINAAYKQSMEMIATGYIDHKAKQRKGQSYQAPNEKEANGEKREGCVDDERDAYRRNSYGKSSRSNNNTSSSSSSSKNEYDKNSKESRNKYGNPERTANFSSANSYANAERQAGSWQRSTDDTTSSQHSYHSKSEYYNSFMNSTIRNHPEDRPFHSCHHRDANAKAHNKSADWFKEMYESSTSKWNSSSSHHQQNTNQSSSRSSTTPNDEYGNSRAAPHNQKFYSANQKFYNSFDGAYKGGNNNNTASGTASSNNDESSHEKSGGTRSQQDKNGDQSNNNKNDGENSNNNNSNERNDEHCRYEQYRKTSFSSSSEEAEFGADEGWFEFRENFFRQNRHITSRDLYRFRFSQATTVEEIDSIYKQSMDENIFSGYDIGEPLFLALERYHLGLGLGDKHLFKCFSVIDDWEGRTKRTAVALYYHVILKLYTNDRIMSLFPELDSTVATEVVWRVLQRMQDKGVVDDECVGRSWWELLRLACMHRDPDHHHW